MTKVPLLLLLLLTCSFAEIIHTTIVVKREKAVDLDNGLIIHSQLGTGDLGIAEFVYHGDGLEWVNTDMRNYTFLRNSWLCRLPYSALNTVLNPEDSTLFCKSTPKTPMTPVESAQYIGGDSSGITLRTHQDSLFEGVKDIPTDQIFLTRSSNNRYLLARIKKYYISFHNNLGNFDVDSLVLETWKQTDGSTDFSALPPALPVPCNFYAEHYYDMPENGFSFKWDPIAHDSLVGYQIYVDNYPLIRTSDTKISRSYYHMEKDLETVGAPEQYFWHNSVATFYVKAIYGTDEEESESSVKLERDIVWATSLLSESTRQDSSPYIFTGNALYFPENVHGTASLFTLLGKLVQKVTLKEGVSIPLHNLTSQLYILSIENSKGITHYQVIKE